MFFDKKHKTLTVILLITVRFKKGNVPLRKLIFSLFTKMLKKQYASEAATKIPGENLNILV